ncbi:hypothetical protein A7K91_09545 [Paenibacillus oryzae]|uniref:Uncharacterized protein n=1 Tax=Paenibacillus oryzae TaxID=1844972 RepID=A0A1A5YBH8_9BACL|nr:hypothetical protein [Paenibacillus oryzae]OBR62951.1 hypothetical protein A7K91_09545 [Paenibacillus oryzae]
MVIEEFDFYRKVRAYYCKVNFDLLFTYRFAHRLDKTAMARGSFGCSVNYHAQTVEYTMQLVSDVIERPFSESGSFLFSTIYEAIPPQRIEYHDYPIHKLRYKVPIDYDWQAFIEEGAASAINRHTIGALFKKWGIKDEQDREVDAHIKITKLTVDWKGSNQVG